MAIMKMSVLGDTLSGKSGSLVFSDTKNGVVVRPRTSPKNPRSPRQVAQRNRFGGSSTRFDTLTPAQVATWANYAGTQSYISPKSGKTITPSALNVYNALATKFLQVNPAGTPPASAPTTGYVGDNVTVTATGGGKLTFVADKANVAGTTTELLLQPLKTRYRKPLKNGYQPQQFFTFATGSLSVDLTVPAGWYAVAYRFVKSATGQSTLLIPGEIVQIS